MHCSHTRSKSSWACNPETCNELHQHGASLQLAPSFGFLRCAGASAGSGNASREWTEFKRYKRQNKHTQARDASSASYGSSVDEAWAGDAASGAAAGTSGSAGAAASSSGSSGEDPRWAGMPTAGQVVEYPLSQQQKDELQDGRTHGVGLLVGRNCDR